MAWTPEDRRKNAWTKEQFHEYAMARAKKRREYDKAYWLKRYKDLRLGTERTIEHKLQAAMVAGQGRFFNLVRQYVSEKDYAR